MKDWIISQRFGAAVINDTIKFIGFLFGVLVLIFIAYLLGGMGTAGGLSAPIILGAFRFVLLSLMVLLMPLEWFTQGSCFVALFAFLGSAAWVLSQF